MLSQRDKSTIIGILDETLGVGTSLKGNEQAHHCPFCHHHKKKLQINLDTQQWHCWVCDTKGKKITSLLKRLHVDSKRVRKIYEIYGDDYIISTSTEEEKVELRLPNEFRSLLKEPKGLNPLFRKVKQYRNKEGLHERILLSTILVIVILVITPIVLLFHLMILITDSITSSHVLYTMRKSLSIRIRQYRRMLSCSKTK